MSPKTFNKKPVHRKQEMYSNPKVPRFELYSSEGLLDLESPPLKLSTHVMSTRNISTWRNKGYKSDHSMCTCYTSSVDVQKKATMHISLGHVTKQRKQPDQVSSSQTAKKRKALPCSKSATNKKSRQCNVTANDVNVPPNETASQSQVEVDVNVTKSNSTVVSTPKMETLCVKKIFKVWKHQVWKQCHEKQYTRK